MIKPETPLGKLLDGPMRPGRVVWIGLRPARRAAMLSVERAELKTGFGLVGDRYSAYGGVRQVTLIAAEHLAAIGGFLGLSGPAAPERLRRNIVVSGINLLALKDRRFLLGEAVLEWSGECDPCSRMDEELGPGGYNAVRRHGGITARVLESGAVALGDAIARLPLEAMG